MTIDQSLRDALLEDVPAITEIYAHAVLNTVATLDTEQPTIASQTEWFHHHDKDHPVIVAVQDGVVVGWGSLSVWSPKQGYRTTAEASVYIAPDHQGRGIGTALTLELIRRARTVGLHVIVARIASSNEVSLRVARHCGFLLVGTMRESGFKFGEYVDVDVLQRLINTE